MKIKRGLQLLIALYFFINAVICAQPKLKIVPESIHFENVFDRLAKVLLINEGNDVLEIDSISYKANLYYARYNVPTTYPLPVQPGDTVQMECILNRYKLVTSADTSNTIKVYDEFHNEIGIVKIKIDFFNDDQPSGIIKGKITDCYNAPVANALVYFFEDGRYLADSTASCADGCFSKKIPVGNYKLLISKESYLTTFYNQKYDLFNATEVCVEKDSIKEISVTLHEDSSTGISISGSILDSLTKAPVKRAIIVIRKGKHYPSKLATTVQPLITDEVYTTVANSEGKFHINVPDSDYYYMQAFSDFYIPAYYSDKNNCAVLWQEADSLFINADLQDKNILLKRDSSFGAGFISGTITVENNIAENYGDIVVLVKSTSNDNYVSYNFINPEGRFKITNLPYGNFKLIAQKIGYSDAISSSIVILPYDTAQEGVSLNLLTTAVDEKTIRPTRTQLLQNFPNPFNPITNIQLFISKRGLAKVSVYNTLGQKIDNLYEGIINEGFHHFTFDGDKLGTGIYIILLETNDVVETKKILLLK